MGIFEGQVAIVTGGGGGVGRATAWRLTAEGASVVVADIDEAAARATVEIIGEAGGIAIASLSDVADEASVKAMVATAVDTFGRLDLLHNNAVLQGLADGDVTELDVDVFDRKMAVNARGVMLGCKHAIPALRAGGGGAIVNMASVSGLVGTDENLAYGTSKAAIIGMTRYVASMVGKDGIRCNAIAPGLIMTARLEAHLSAERVAMYAAERLLPWPADPNDIAGVVAFLASDAGRCITGQTIVVDCGTTAHRPRHAIKAWESSLRDATSAADEITT
ncbi:MAG: SDR family oxidoreductase [Actinomycetota bacterium]|nr:SDR family oxidoreductase [Actinomycetota bacterium]